MSEVRSDRVDAPEFLVVRTEEGDNTVVALHGELDLAGTDEVARKTETIVPGTTVTVDMRELAFIDSSGIHALMKLDVRARAEGWTLRLAAPQDAVRRVLELCNFADRVPILPA